MKLFGINEAAHYCKTYSPQAGDAEGPLETFVAKKLKRRPLLLTEGTNLFDQYRSCSLREVERYLFLSAAHYRRCLDSMIPGSSSWAYVTIYYGCWYAAHALLGIFGCAIFERCIIDVNLSSPGTQELNLRAIGTKPGQEPTTYGGSHQIFWDLFYREVIPLRPLLSPHLAAAIAPISNDPTWQTYNRNQVNYHTLEAIKLGKDFQSSFSRRNFPSSLPGILRTQYGIFDALIELSFYYARNFGLQTDALVGLGKNGNLASKIQRLIYGGRQHILIKSTKQQMLFP